MAFHIDYTVCIILMGILPGIYVIAGGYMATAINDFVQGLQCFDNPYPPGPPPADPAGPVP